MYFMVDCKKQITFLLISITKLCWESVPAEVSKTSSLKEQKKKETIIHLKKGGGEKGKRERRKSIFEFWFVHWMMGFLLAILC